MLITTMYEHTDRLLKHYIAIRANLKSYEKGTKKGIGFAESR